jgi:sugar lactone lactonase YvrE
MLNQAPSLSFLRHMFAALVAGTLLPAFAQNISAPLTVTTLAGSAGVAQVINGTGAAARFSSPAGIIIDGSGNLIVADTVNNLFRKVTPAGVVTIFSGSPVDPDNNPINVGSTDGSASTAKFHIGDSAATLGSMTLGIDSSGNIYFADTMNCTIRKITPSGTVTTIAGAPSAQDSIDGPGASARFNVPGGVAVDSSGNIFVADSGNDTIRKITPDGTVTTFAGTARAFGNTDGTGAAARFTNPSGIAVDAAGNLYVTDSANHTIRKITPSGIVTTLAGSPGNAGTADGGATQARFRNPCGIAVDASGNVYVADTGNHAIRKVTPSGTVTTIAGMGGVSGSADGTGTSARFFEPYGLTVSSTGIVYISDSSNDTIRAGVPATGSGSLQITGVPPARIQVTTTANVTLKIAASGTPSPTYQWYKDGIAVSGATDATLGLSSVTSTNAGNYSVTVASGLVTYTSAATQLQVFAPGTPVSSVVIVTQPTDRTVAAGQSTTFTVEATSAQPLTYQWAKNGSAITGATSATYTVASAQSNDVAQYTVTVSDGASTATTANAALTVTGGTSAVAPAITTQPVSQTANVGSSVSFTVGASGTPSPTFQWEKDGVTLANGGTLSGATSATLTISSVTSSDAGTYKAYATNSAGTAVSNAAILTVGQTPPPGGPTAWLTNLSVRTTMDAGQTLTVGMYVNGGAENILVRGAGPALTPWVDTPMADPRLDLYKDQTFIYSNDNWDYALRDTFTSVAAFPFAQGSKDAAFVQSLSGSHSIRINGTGPGTVLVEGYALGAGNSPRLTNISALNRTAAGGDILTAGFYVSGTGKIRLLIRGVGPYLSRYFSDYLVDPALEVHKSASQGGGLIAQNDTWDPSLAPVFTSVAAFPLDAGSKDAAMIVELDAGTDYTVQVKGPAGTSGQALIELYELPQN